MPVGETDVRFSLGFNLSAMASQRCSFDEPEDAASAGDIAAQVAALTKSRRFKVSAPFGKREPLTG
jgi:hypothetical protein